MGTPARRSGGMWQRWVSTGRSAYRTLEMGCADALWLAAIAERRIHQALLYLRGEVLDALPLRALTERHPCLTTVFK